MSVLDAENSFRAGLVALLEGRPGEAASRFQRAMLTEKEHHVSRRRMRYLSYFGLSVAMSQGPTRDAIRACETAVRNEFYNPDLILNLGKVYLLAGLRGKALAVFARGLTIDPNHSGLLAAMQRADRRRARPVGFLQRSHPVNKWLGRMRRA